MEKDYKSIIILGISILVILIVVVGGTIINKKKDDSTDNTKLVDVGEVDNVSIVDEKLKEGDYRVTQSYLLTYTKYKSNTWYSSKGVISKISIKDNIATITISDGDKQVIGTIDSDNIEVKKNDEVYFVGTIDLDDGYINYSKISKEEIGYSNVVEITLSDLSDNIYYLRNTYVIVSGYMITAADKYKLYSSKDDYKDDEEVGSYFSIDWNNDFNYTGTADVVLKCFIGGRYKLVGCEIAK